MIFKQLKLRPLYDLNKPGHAKTCLMPYANNKGADQLRIRAVSSVPLFFAA